MKSKKSGSQAQAQRQDLIVTKKYEFILIIYFQ